MIPINDSRVDSLVHASPPAGKASEEIADPRVKDIVKQFGTLQQNWTQYLQSPNGVLRDRITRETANLQKSLPKIANAIENFQSYSDYLIASSEQLKEITAYHEHTAQTANQPIPKKNREELNKQYFQESRPSISKLSDSYKREMECRALLQANGLELRNVPGDGNCGLYAILRGLGRPGQTAADAAPLRAQLVDHMRKNGRDVIEPSLTDISFEDYCAQMARDKTWIGEQELRLLSDLLKRPIWVYRPDNLAMNKGSIEPNNNYKYGQDYQGAPIRLYHSSSHYQLLQPK